MSIRTHLEYIHARDGILAVVVEDSDGHESRGDERLVTIALACLDVAHRSEETILRFLVGQHVIVVSRHDNDRAAVVHPRAHAVAKDVHRALRKAHRRAMPPVPAEPVQRPSVVPKSPAPKPTRTVVPTRRPKVQAIADGAWFAGPVPKRKRMNSGWETEGLPSEATRPW